MKVLKFKGLLQNKTWISPAYVQLSAKGKIEAIKDSFQPFLIWTVTKDNLNSSLSRP